VLTTATKNSNSAFFLRPRHHAELIRNSPMNRSRSFARPAGQLLKSSGSAVTAPFGPALMSDSGYDSGFGIPPFKVHFRGADPVPFGLGHSFEVKMPGILESTAKVMY